MASQAGVPEAEEESVPEARVVRGLSSKCVPK